MQGSGPATKTIVPQRLVIKNSYLNHIFNLIKYIMSQTHSHKAGGQKAELGNYQNFLRGGNAQKIEQSGEGAHTGWAEPRGERQNGGGR